MTDEHDDAATVVVEETIVERTGRKLLEQRRAEAQAREKARQAVLEEISPACVRVLTTVDDTEVLCGHKLRRHDPCSDCVCPGFVDADGRDAAAAAAAVIDAHPEIFPSRREDEEEGAAD